MTAEQILAALDKYEAKLADYDALRVDTSLDRPNPAGARKHLAWMIPEIRVFVAEGALAKAERWVCFLQGVAWSFGWDEFTSGPSIDDFREDNRTPEVLPQSLPEEGYHIVPGTDPPQYEMQDEDGQYWPVSPPRPEGSSR